jgi:hypothetical protein
MYDNGLGVPQDYVIAHMWFNLAAAGGEIGAPKARAGVAEKMTPAQIAEAQELAREWKPKWRSRILGPDYHSVRTAIAPYPRRASSSLTNLQNSTASEAASAIVTVTTSSSSDISTSTQRRSPQFTAPLIVWQQRTKVWRDRTNPARRFQRPTGWGGQRSAQFSQAPKNPVRGQALPPLSFWRRQTARNLGETLMRQFTIAAATVAIAALISAAPAAAEAIFGGPVQQNGKCWHGKNHSSSSESTWGYWESCAERASQSGRRGGGAAPQATTHQRS